MRGEDHMRAHADELVIGSPPHARGRPDLIEDLFGPARITPACAGKTLWSGRWGLPIRDHPRMRGED